MSITNVTYLHAARGQEDLLAELLLATREEVIKRSERRTGLGDDLLDRARFRAGLRRADAGAVVRHGPGDRADLGWHCPPGVDG